MNRDIIVFDFETGGRNPHMSTYTVAALALMAETSNSRVL